MFVKSRIFQVLCIISVLFFITGCDTSSSSSSPAKTQTGTQGIVMNFVENAPPEEIFIDTASGDNRFEATLELKNKGAYPKDGEALVGRLHIGGFDNSVIDGTWDGGSELPPNLIGKSQFFPEGGYEIKSYIDENIDYSFDSDNYKPTIQVTACYDYKTRASPLICIDPNPSSTSSGRKVCTVKKDTTMSGGQGGPVGVTRIEQSSSGRKTFFKIYISNLGRGTVIAQDAVSGSGGSSCLDLGIDQVNKVEVTTRISGLGNGDCTPEGTPSQPVRLQSNGQGMIVCSFENPTGVEAYTTPLEITMTYGYSESISKQVNLIKMN